MPEKSAAKAAISRIAVWGAIAALFFAACPNPGEPPVLVESIVINSGDLTLKAGDIADISVTVTPGNATDNGVSWFSGDAGVAMAGGGRVTAIAAGTAVIIAAARDGSGRAGTILVTVVDEGDE